MRWVILSLLIGLLASPAMAQDEEVDVTAPTAATEAFSVLPNVVNAGAQDLELRLSAGTKGLFASSSIKAPEIAFGEGITAAEGSFSILNTSEAKVTVNVLETLVGGIEVKISFFSKDGTTTIRQERATLTVIRDLPVAETGHMVAAEKINLVAVNVASEQTLGAVLLKGRISGNYTYTPPTGMTFMEGQTPVVTIDEGDATVSNLAVSASRESLTFTIVNTASSNLTVRLDSLVMKTEGFGDAGGMLGNQISTITGTSFGDDEALVINAHTALTKLEGDAVETEDPTSDDGTETTDDSTTDDGTTDDGTTSDTSTSGSNSNSGTSSSSSRSNNRTNNNRESSNRNNRNNAGRDTSNDIRRRNTPAPNFRPNSSRPRSTSSRRNWGGRSKRSNGGSRSSGGASGSGGGVAPTSEESMPVRYSDNRSSEDKSEEQPLPDFRTSKPAKLVRSNKLYFTDKDFNRIENVVIDKNLRNGKAAMVWVVLERGKDVTDEVDTVTVDLRLGAQVQTLTLTETGPKTGIFRSAKGGIAVSMTGK